MIPCKIQNSCEGLVDVQQWKREKVKCDHCGKVLVARTLDKHLEVQHGFFRSLVLNKDLIENKGNSQHMLLDAQVSIARSDDVFPQAISGRQQQMKASMATSSTATQWT